MKRTIAWFSAAILALLGVLRGADLAWRREQILREGERRAANLTLVLSEVLRSACEGADATLRQLVLHGRRVGGADVAREAWADVLDSAKSGAIGISSLSVTDAAGVIRQSTLPERIGQARSGRPLFERLTAASEDLLVADTPFSTPIGFVMPLGRRLEVDGRFAGVVVATLVPSQLREFFRRVDVGARGGVWVFHEDGFVFLHEPSVGDPIGQTASQYPVFVAAVAGHGSGDERTGLMRGPAVRGESPSLSAFRSLAGTALIVAVSLNQVELLAPWRREVYISLAVLGVFALVMVEVLRLLFRHMDARVEAEQSLARARRLEAIGQLTGGVAHDFNNLLTVILGNAYLLKADGSAKGAAAAEALEQIEQAGQRAAELVSGLLAFARRQPLSPRLVDLSALTAGLESMLRRLLGEDIALRIAAAPEPCWARLDPAQTETALINLCLNARDAMPRGGLLAIESSLFDVGPSPPLDSPELATGRYVVVAVSDTGEGVAPENLPKLFEPFFTTKEVGKGTGLGLSMVYGFVKQSGGQVKVDSEVGRGTTLRLFFPAVEPPATTPSGRVVATAPLRGGGETILLVEDEEGVRAVATAALRRLGYRVLVAADGPEALLTARAEPRIDLLLTDVVLPNDWNGRRLAEELQRLRPGLSVLYSSGYSAEIVEHRGEIEPGLRLLSKPYTLEQLAEAVRAALGGEKT